MAGGVRRWYCSDGGNTFIGQGKTALLLHNVILFGKCVARELLPFADKELLYCPYCTRPLLLLVQELIEADDSADANKIIKIFEDINIGLIKVYINVQKSYSINIALRIGECVRKKPFLNLIESTSASDRKLRRFFFTKSRSHLQYPACPVVSC